MQATRQFYKTEQKYLIKKSNLAAQKITKHLALHIKWQNCVKSVFQDSDSDIGFHWGIDSTAVSIFVALLRRRSCLLRNVEECQEQCGVVWSFSILAARAALYLHMGLTEWLRNNYHSERSTRQCARIWSDNLQLPYTSKLEVICDQLPCVQPPTSSYDFQLPHGRHGQLVIMIAIVIIVTMVITVAMVMVVTVVLVNMVVMVVRTGQDRTGQDRTGQDRTNKRHRWDRTVLPIAISSESSKYYHELKI